MKIENSKYVEYLSRILDITKEKAVCYLNEEKKFKKIIVMQAIYMSDPNREYYIFKVLNKAEPMFSYGQCSNFSGIEIKIATTIDQFKTLVDRVEYLKSELFQRIDRESKKALQLSESSLFESKTYGERPFSVKVNVRYK